MSALLAPLERAEQRPARPTLRALDVHPLRVGRIGFVIVLLTLLGAGMVGVLVLNTMIQQRAGEVTAVQRQADDLGYQQASLTAEVERLRSSSDLAERAWQMGLRPNPYPVFVQLETDGTGRVVGEPTRVFGGEMPNQKYASADDVTKQIDAARAAYKAKQEAQKKALAEKIARQKAEAARKAEAAKQAEAARKAAAATRAKATPSAKPTGGN
ncbi:hypothetical protein [Luteococcus peritonei]|uniref:Cell division protein FtsL n=1 Tax=Luteococcus peritonei TaxID=88874 RepID=A0ABW4RQQ3_9ACTN